MALPDEGKLIQIHWNLGGGAEEAVMTYHLDNSSIDKSNQELVDRIQDIWSGHWDDVKSNFSSSIKVDYIKAYELDTTGHARASATAFGDFAGTSGGKVLPYEVAFCQNFYNFDPQTVVANRGRKRGRWYFPAPVATHLNDFDGCYTDLFVDAMGDFTAGFFASHQDLYGPLNVTIFGEQPCILSRVDETYYSIEYIGADNVPDVQRRRRRQQVATHVVRQQVNY